MPGEVLFSLEEKMDPRHAAVLVVDVQNDFCAEGGYSHKAGREMRFVQEMMPNLIAFLEEARKARCPVIFVRMISGGPYVSPAMIELKMRKEKKEGKSPQDWPCVEGTWGADFYQVKPLPGELVVTKHRASAFVGTDLDLILRSRGIKTLIMVGVLSNVCVESTARSATMLDYYVVFLEDCTASRKESLHRAALDNINFLFGQVRRSEEVVKAWQNIGVLR